MAQFFRVLAFEENGVWVSLCLDLDIVSQGGTMPHSLLAVADAIELVAREYREVPLTTLYQRSPDFYWRIRSEVLRNGQTQETFLGVPKRAYARLKLEVRPGFISHSYEEILVDGVQVTHVHSDSNEGW